MLVLCCLLAGTQASFAESRSFSYSIWSVVGQSVHASFIVPAAEARRLAAPDAAAPTSETIAKDLAQHVAVSSAAGPCPPVDQGEEIGLVYTLTSSPGFSRFEIEFQCRQSSGITLQNAFLFERVPSHVNIARIQIGDGGFVTRLFTAARERIALPATSSELGNAGVYEYARLGLSHITESLDRLCFVLAFLLVGCRWRDLGYLVGGASLGYLLAAAVAISGTVAPRMELIEPLLGFLVVLVAAEAVARASQRPWAAAWLLGGGVLALSAVLLFARASPASLLLAGIAVFTVCYLSVSSRLVDSAALRLVPAALFGMLDGFGFAADLSVLKLSPSALVPMLLSFDIGALAVIALLASALVAVAALLRARGLAGWPTVADLAAAALVGLGIFWFVGRLTVA
jgi:HupE / UreJ protein